MKAVLIGTGFAARFHYESMLRVGSDRPDIAGAWSPDEGRRSKFCAERSIRAFDTLEEALEAGDVIHVCSPPSTHEAICVAALEAGKHAVVEKPFTGYFGDGSPGFSGIDCDKQTALKEALASCRRIADAEASGPGKLFYAENWVYAPAIQKERDVILKSDARVLWIRAEESHSGSHAASYGIWSQSGGGSLMGKSVHPLTATLYLKQAEGIGRNGKAIRPKSVSARIHRLTADPAFRDLGYLRKGYTDIEDLGVMHILFDDNTVADIFASDIVMGGVNNLLEVIADNHRSKCNINPNTAMQSYTPDPAVFEGIYISEKIETSAGWNFMSPDEDWFAGYQHEMKAFYGNIASGTEPEAGTPLASSVIATVYAAYLSAERQGAEVPVPGL
jgi:predicted dehydrogenase